MKKILILTFCIMLICTCVYADASISYKNNIVTLNDAPDNATAIVVSYNDKKLEDVKMQNIVDGNTIDITDLKKEADTFKVFILDLNTLTPLGNEIDITADVTKEQSGNSMTLTINGKEYTAVLEENATADAFKKMLPLELNMNELNGNEKYNYLSESLPSNSQRAGRIEAGDIMLYGNSCIVLFYKSFNTSYSYTKICHIENISGLSQAVGTGSVIISFE